MSVVLAGSTVITVVVVDDHAIVRSGLVALLGGVEDITILAACASGEEALTTIPDLNPDVVLMDLELPGIDGVETIARLTDEGIRAAIVVLTSFSDTERILRAFEAGAIGYLLKDAMPDDVIAGVRSAAIGDAPIAPRAARALLVERRRADDVEVVKWTGERRVLSKLTRTSRSPSDWRSARPRSRPT
jgi:DNA-binding NarL/FixJ family response regulator